MLKEFWKYASSMIEVWWGLVKVDVDGWVISLLLGNIERSLIFLLIMKRLGDVESGFMKIGDIFVIYYGEVGKC